MHITDHPFPTNTIYCAKKNISLFRIIIFLVLAVELTSCRSVKTMADASEDQDFYAGRLHHFKTSWYAKHMKAFQEPSLPNIKNKDIECYRFTYMPEHFHPVCIRFEKNGDQPPRMIIKEHAGGGGYEPGELLINVTRELSDSNWLDLVNTFNKTGFWDKAPDSMMENNTQLILEGLKDGQYHLVDRGGRPIYDLKHFRYCCSLLKKSGIFEERKKPYYRNYHKLIHEFEIALKNDDAVRVKTLLNSGFDPAAVTLYGSFPLVRATLQSKVNIVKVILNNMTEEQKKRILGNLDYNCKAGIQVGAPEMEELLIKHGADLNFQDDMAENATSKKKISANVPPASGEQLSKAIVTGNIALVRNMIKSGVKLEPDHLLEAIKKNRKKIVALILETRQLDINKIKLGRFGITPLETACARGAFDVARLLIESGIDISHARGAPALYYSMNELHKGAETVRLLLEKGVDPRYKRAFEIEMLINSARNGDEVLVKEFLAKGVNINSMGQLGWTPLHAAISSKQLEMIEFLLSEGADIESKDGNDFSPLQFAYVNLRNQQSESKHDVYDTKTLQIIKLLKKHGARFSPEIQLYNAYLDNDLVRFKKLLKEGANPNKGIHSEFGALLHRAVMDNKKTVVETLLNHPATDINIRDHKGYTPFMWGCENSTPDYDILRLLLAKGADPNMANVYGETPLGLYGAAHMQSTQFIELLLEYGADINTVSPWQETMLEIARRKGSVENIRVIKRYLEKAKHKAEKANTGITRKMQEN